jgi:hypothetical protein
MGCGRDSSGSPIRDVLGGVSVVQWVADLLKYETRGGLEV